NERHALLLEPRGLAREAAEVVELRAPHPASPRDLDPLDPGRVQREGALHADSVRDAPYREGGATALAAAPDDDALDQLQPLLLALDALDVHAHRAAGREPRTIFLQ